MHGHVIVCGLQGVGLRAVEQFHLSGTQVVVIDDDGFQHVRSTSALAAPWFVGAALGLDVLSTFYVDQQPFLVAGLSVAPSGGLQGRAMRDLSLRTRVIALSRAADGVLEHPPRRGTVFAGGDTAFLLGPYEELLRVLQRDQTPV